MQRELTRDLLQEGDRLLSDRLSCIVSRQDSDFPSSFSKWSPNEEFFPLIYDEIVDALSKLTDYAYAGVRRTACGPLEVDVAAHNFTYSIHLLNAIEKLAEKENPISPDLQTTPLLVTAPQRVLLRLYTTLVFCHEKFLPTAKEAIDKPENSLLSAVVTDLSAQRFYDLRNALAHWNACLGQNSLIFFSQRSDKNKNGKEFIRKQWNSDAILIALNVAQFLCLAMFAAFQWEEVRRSH